MSKPLFIVFEGIDGSGKSTQAKRLVQWMTDQKLPVQHHTEPTNSDIGLLIRQKLASNEISHHGVIAGLFVADRLDHILKKDTGIKAVLSKGEHVVCDRYYFSSIAYQGAYLPLSWVIDANSIAIQSLQADITFYLDISPDQALQRIMQRQQKLDLFETKENLNKIYNAYQQAFEKVTNGENIFVLDATLSEDVIHEIIIKKIQSF